MPQIAIQIEGPKPLTAEHTLICFACSNIIKPGEIYALFPAFAPGQRSIKVPVCQHHGWNENNEDNETEANPMTVDLILPYDLAEKCFGLYLHGTDEKADLSTLTGEVFFDEISTRILYLDPQEQQLVSTRLETALAIA